MSYPIISDNYENEVRTKPDEFAMHFGGRRFLVRARTSCSKCGPGLEVYGYGLEHICWVPNQATGWMIADALEIAGNATESGRAG